MRSRLLVVVQLACIFILAFTAPVLSSAACYILMAELVAVLLGLWAVILMQVRSRLSLLPELRSNAELITSGPYRLIRHPMYSALLLLTIAWVFEKIIWWRILVELVLATVIAIKISMEEKYLQEKFPAYSGYMKNTRKLIPFIY